MLALLRAACALTVVIITVPLGLSLPGLSPAPDPAEVGRWTAPFGSEVPAVTMALLPNGKVLYWSGAVTDDVETMATFLEAPEKARARILDLSSGAPAITTPTPEDLAPEDVFCAGQSHLHDGRLFAAGGTRYAPIPESGGFHLFGVDQTVVFDPATETFTVDDDMLFARWYPTLLTLPDGDVLAVGGTEDLFQGGNVALPERYDAATGEWATLPARAANLLPLYPHVHLVPTGPFAGQVVYLAAGCISCTSDDTYDWGGIQTLDLATGGWEKWATTVPRDYPASLPLPLRAPDHPTRYLVMGGGVVDALAGLDTIAGVPTAYVVDMSAGLVPERRDVASMAHPRFFGHGILLPTGDVLAVGGTLLGAKAVRQNPAILPAEIYDPEADRWTTLAPMQVGRGYHSTAILLPDARVLVGGYVPLGSVATDILAAPETTFEIFEPPYLFQGPRPTILHAPSEARHGDTLAIATADKEAHAVLVRPGATTHVVDTEQRVVELTMDAPTGSGVVAKVPEDRLVVPPGPWMLFLVKDGVPSVASFIHVRD